MTNNEQPNPNNGEVFKPAFEPEPVEDLDRKELNPGDEIPQYIQYWREQELIFMDQRERKTYDPYQANLARAKFSVMQDLRRHTLHSGERVEGRGVHDTVLYQSRQWLHMLGPDNPLEGAGPDLELAAKRIIENLDQAKTHDVRGREIFGEREKLQLDAAGALMAASRLAESPDERTRLRSESRGLLRETVVSPNYGNGVEGYKADAYMLGNELAFDELMDRFEIADMTDEEFAKAFGILHAQQIAQFRDVLGPLDRNSATPPGKAYEWWFLLLARHRQLLGSSPEELTNTRFMAALPHEDAPHYVEGMHDPLSDGRDVLIAARDEDGEMRTKTLLQLKSHGQDDKLYRSPIIEIEVKDIDLQDPAALMRLIKRTTGTMYGDLKSGAAKMTDTVDMEWALEVTHLDEI